MIECFVWLRRKRFCANPGTFTITLALRHSISPPRPRFLRVLCRLAVRSGARQCKDGAAHTRAARRQDSRQGCKLFTAWGSGGTNVGGRRRVGHAHRAPQCRTRTTPPGKGDRVGPPESDYAAAPSKWQRTRAKHDEHVNGRRRAPLRALVVEVSRVSRVMSRLCRG